MKKFSFSLERVLNYKEQIEQSLRSEHGQAVMKVKKKEEQIQELETMFTECRKTWGAKEMSVTTIAKMRRYTDYLGTLTGKISSEKDTLKKLQKEEELKREQVIEAKKETSSIQKLKEKKKREYDELAAKVQEREVEEFVSNRSVSGKSKTG